MLATRILVLVTLLLSTPVWAAPPDPAELLAGAKAASGGDAWDTAAALRLEADVATGGLTGTAESWEDLRAGRVATTFVLGPITGAEGFDGTSVWSQDDAGLVTINDGGESRQRAAVEAYLRALAHFYPERWPAKVGYGRLAEDGERRFHVLEIEPEGGRRFEMWLDADTLLLDRTVDPAPRETRTVFFSDYRRVDGVLVAFAQRSSNGEEKYDLHLTLRTARIVPEVDDGHFEIPEGAADDFKIAGGAARAVVPFELLNNHIFAEARVNGHGPLRFLVDTGGVNLLTPEAAAELGLESQGTFEARGVGEKTEDIGFTRVERFELGDVELTGQTFFVLPLRELDKVEGATFAGLVGFEVFKRFVVTIDYAAGRLVLTRPEAFTYDGPGTAVPFTFDERTPQMEGEIDGVKGLFTLDTGSRSSLSLHAPFVEEHGLVEKYGARVERLVGWGVGGGVRALMTRAGVLKLGDVEIPAPVMDVTQVAQGSFSDTHVAGNVGGGVLKRFTVTFDYSRKRVIFEKNAAFDRPDPADRSGLWIHLDGDAFTVVDVVAGSPAERAGLAVDDRILAVDGRPVPELSLSAVRERLKTAAPGTEVRLRLAGDEGDREAVLVLADLF